MQERQYTQLFRDKFGREPTPDDITNIGKAIGSTASKKYFRKNGLELDTSLDAIIDDHRIAISKTLDGVSLSDAEIDEIISRKAMDERKVNEAKELRKSKRNEFFRGLRKKAVSVVLTGALIGTAAGTGLGTYKAFTSDRAVNYTFDKSSLEAEYEGKESALENRFFGPLESLTEINRPNSFTPLETKLYAQAYLGSDFVDNLENKRILAYDKVIGDVRIIVNEIPATQHTNSETTITKMDKEGKISEAFRYYNGDTLRDSISIDGDTIRFVNYLNGGVKVVDKEGKVSVNSYFSDSVYTNHAIKIFNEYQLLKSRGPNYNGETKVEN